MPHALVTGVRSPLGWQTALALARGGWSVSGAVQRPASQALLESLARTEELPIAFVRLDLSDEASIRRAAEFAGEQGGEGVDALVHLAEVGAMGTVEEQPDRELRRALDVNFVGPMRLVREILPGMRRRGRGAVVGLKRPSETHEYAKRSAFAGSKAAWEAACDSLRTEVRASGVAVHLVEAPRLNRPLDTAAAVGRRDESESPTLADAVLTIVHLATTALSAPPKTTGCVERA